MTTIITFDRRCGTDDITECAAQIADGLHIAVWIDARNPHRVCVESDRGAVEHWLVSEGFDLGELHIA